MRHFPERSWTVVTFPCFTEVKSFTSWLALLLFFLRFSSVSLHCSPIQFSLVFSCTSWCCFSLPCISQILQVQIFSFSVLSFCRTDQEFLHWSRDFSSDEVCQANYWLFRSLLCEGGDHWIYICIFVAHDDERCKPPAYHSLEGLQHVGIFQLFKVKLESCVFWLADFFFFFRRRRKVIISKSWSLPVPTHSR